MPAQRPGIEQEERAGQGDEHRLGHEAERHAGGDRPHPASARLRDVARVGAKREQPEGGAEDVFAFGDPGHGFDIHGMHGEEQRHRRARPLGAGEPPQCGENEAGIDGVQRDVAEMMPAGVAAKERDIGHVREPGERDPLAGDEVGEHPRDGFRVEPGEHGGVGEDVGVVVEVDELAVEDVGVECDDERDQRGADGGAAAARGRQVEVGGRHPLWGKRGSCPVARAGAEAAAYFSSSATRSPSLLRQKMRPAA